MFRKDISYDQNVKKSGHRSKNWTNMRIQFRKPSVLLAQKSIGLESLLRQVFYKRNIQIG
jgi:hypothetical protein